MLLYECVVNEVADRGEVSHKHSSTHLHVSDLQQREEGKAVQVRSQIDQRHKNTVLSEGHLVNMRERECKSCKRKRKSHDVGHRSSPGIRLTIRQTLLDDCIINDW